MMMATATDPEVDPKAAEAVAVDITTESLPRISDNRQWPTTIFADFPDCQRR
jgi:hypothetical protein